MVKEKWYLKKSLDLYSINIVYSDMKKTLTPLHWYSNHEEFGTKILDWCWDNLGASKFHSYEKPWLSFDEIDNEFLGEYSSSENELVIYIDEINDLEELIRTIIHEYQHYLQSPSWYTRHWDKNLKNYFDHPYEAEAEEIADKYWEICKKEICKNN